MAIIEKPTIGSDIEWFLQDEETKEIVSAEGYIKGSKHDPYHFDPNEHFFATSLDNVLAEGNIPPALTASEFYENVQKLADYIKSGLPSNLTIVSLPAARLDDKYLQTENAKVFGCDPSFNCWTDEIIHPEPKEPNLRSAGFHVHIGYEDPSLEGNIALGKAMDLFLGVPAVLIEPENERKKVGYGCSGNIRHQPHGLEYRSLSGFFSSSKTLIEWCFESTQKAIDFVNSGRIGEIEAFSQDIQNAINNEDKDLADHLVRQFDLELV